MVFKSEQHSRFSPEVGQMWGQRYEISRKLQVESRKFFKNLNHCLSVF
jgi:hypothetical protein